jgi:putative toxin-antitoxin system antitoxin component (TIGR02293 family)
MSNRKHTSIKSDRGPRRGVGFVDVLELIRRKDESGIIHAVEDGVRTAVARELPRALSITRVQVADLLGVSDKTVRRWGRHKELLLPRVVGEKAFRLLQLREKAIAVFEDDDDAVAWLTDPNDAFGGRRPIDHAQTEFGCRQVERLLTRIDQGVYS